MPDFIQTRQLLKYFTIGDQEVRAIDGVDIDIPTLIWKAQFEHYAKHPRSLKKRMLDDPELLAQLGSLSAPLSNWLTSLAITKFFMQLFTGVHRDAHLPTFHRITFKNWFKGSRSGQ